MRRLWMLSTLALVALAQGAYAQEVRVRQPAPPRQQAEEDIVIAGPSAEGPGVHAAATLSSSLDRYELRLQTSRALPTRRGRDETIHMGHGNASCGAPGQRLPRLDGARRRERRSTCRPSPPRRPAATFFINEPSPRQLISTRAPDARKLPNLNSASARRPRLVTPRRIRRPTGPGRIERRFSETHARGGFVFNRPAAAGGPHVDSCPLAKAGRRREVISARRGVDAEGSRTTTTPGRRVARAASSRFERGTRPNSSSSS